MAVSTRTRFEVFKRDSFTCRYCGRKSPEVILEVDHILPVCQGGQDDPINLTTSCWDCNHGKSGVPLSEVMTGEDPHDRAIELAEKERQIAEYNEAARRQRERRQADYQELVDYWCTIRHKEYVNFYDSNYLKYCAANYPIEVVKNCMDLADRRNGTRTLQYVSGCLKNWALRENYNLAAEQ